MPSDERRGHAEATVGHLTEPIRQVNARDRGAREQLFASAYGGLRKLTRSRLRQGSRNTDLDTTALVSELCCGYSEAEIAKRRPWRWRRTTGGAAATVR
jgi:ECF sigma factor